jgi:hypothetical protein
MAVSVYVDAKALEREAECRRILAGSERRFTSNKKKERT